MVVCWLESTRLPVWCGQGCGGYTGFALGWLRILLREGSCSGSRLVDVRGYLLPRIVGEGASFGGCYVVKLQFMGEARDALGELFQTKYTNLLRKIRCKLVSQARYKVPQTPQNL